MTVTTVEDAGVIKWAYKARARDGSVVEGFATAGSMDAVSRELYDRGFLPLAINRADKGFGKEFDFTLRKSVKLKNLALFARQMATALDSGMTAVPALAMMTRQTEDQILSAAIAAVKSDVESGSSISDAMAKQPRVFPPLMISMIRAGEVGGFLDTAMQNVADGLEFEVKLKGQIRGAMAYPTVVLILAFLIGTGMLIFFVPMFAELFDGLGGELPLITRFMIGLSGVMKFALPLMFIGAILFGIWWRKHKNDEAVRAKLDPFKLKVPGLGRLFHKIALARFSRNLSLLLGSGVPIVQALDVSADSVANVRVARAIMLAKDSVREGGSISTPLEADPDIFPAMLTQMVTVGEESGRLDQMLAKAAKFYEEEVEVATKSLQSLIEPLMMIFVGGIVGSIVLAMFYPYVAVGGLILNQ